MRIRLGETLDRARKRAASLPKTGFAFVLGVAFASKMHPAMAIAIACDRKTRL
jgi:hypothetical protein